MYINVTETMFKDMFVKMGRKDNFSYAGLSALYEYLIDLEDATGVPMECDVIAICCDFTETSVDDFIGDFDHLFDSEELAEMDDDEKRNHVLEVTNDHTMVIPVNDDTFIYQAF